MSVAGYASTSGSTGPVKVKPVGPRFCSICGEPIAEYRLRIQPTARQCVPCLNAAGDVAPIKRFDEMSGENSVETYFIRDYAIERQAYRAQTCTPDAKVLADSTESAVVADSAPETNAEARAHNTVFAMIERHEEDTCAN